MTDRRRKTPEKPPEDEKKKSDELKKAEIKRIIDNLIHRDISETLNKLPLRPRSIKDRIRREKEGLKEKPDNLRKIHELIRKEKKGLKMETQPEPPTPEGDQPPEPEPPTPEGDQPPEPEPPTPEGDQPSEPEDEKPPEPEDEKPPEPEDEKPPEPEDEKPPEPEDEKPPEPEKDKPTDKPPEEQNDKPKMVPGAAPHTGSRGPLIPGRRLSKASPKPKPRPPKPKKKKLSFWQRLLITMGFAPRGTKKKRKLSSKINEGLRPAARKIDGVIRKGVKKVSQGVDKIGKSIKSRGKGSKLESSLSVGAKETGKDMGSLNRKNGDSKKIIGDMSIKKSIENPIESDSKEFSESGQELKDNFKKFIENNTINHGFGVAVPLETVEKGRLRESINKVDTFEKFPIKNLETGKLLEDLREKLQLSKNKFSNLININSTSYHEVIRDKKGMNLKKFTQIPDLTYIKNSLTSQELKEIKIKAERILTSKDTIITCGRAHLNFNIDNLERIKIGKRDHIVLPTSEYELKGAREEAKKKVINYFNEYGKAPSAKVIRQLGLKGFYTNEEKYGRTHNDFLKECKVPIIQERIRNKPIEQEINIKPKLDESVEPIKELKINFQRFLDKEILQRGYGVIVPLNILKMVNYMKLFQKLINSINSLYKTLN